MAYYRLRSGAPAPGYAYKKRRTAGSSSTQQQLALLKRKVNQLKPEVKCWSMTGQHANVATAVGDIQLISTITQGVTKSARLGDQIRLTRLQFRIQFIDTLLSTARNFGNRIIIVRDKAATGAVPSISGTASSVLTSAVSLAQQLPATLDRYVILKDYTYNTQQLIDGTINGHFYFDMKMNVVLDYLGADGSQASAGANALYCIVLTDATTASQDWNFSANLYFTDA